MQPATVDLPVGGLEKGEDIARVTYTRPLDPRRSLELGLDRARNTLDQHLAVQFDLNGDGLVEPVAIPTAIAQVRELLPERTWSYELGYQERFGGDTGLLELRAYYNDVSGRIEKAPLRDAFGLYSASGNLPVAYSKGAELKASMRLEPMHLRNTLVTLRYGWQQSNVTDPFTGVPRRISSDRGNTYELGLRQDWLRARVSAGFTCKNTGGAVISNRLLVSSQLVLRLERQNVGGAREIQTRTLYAVNAIDGRVARFDRYDEYRDTRIALRLRGQF